MRVYLLCSVMLAALPITGCTGRQVYDSAAGWRQSECNKILDDAARAKCMETASKDYDRYRKEQ